MTNTVSIPQPCSEDWNAMQPNANGRHCTACATTVTDFTGWAPEEIAAYLMANRSSNVCGRFSQEQLTDQSTSISFSELAKNIQAATISFTKKIAIIILTAIGISTASCGNETIGKAIVNEPMQPEVEKCKTDSIILMGEIIIEKEE